MIRSSCLGPLQYPTQQGCYLILFILYLTLNGTVDTSGEESSWCAGWSKVDNGQNLSWGTGESNVVWASWHKGLNTVLHHTRGVYQHMNIWQSRCSKCSARAPAQWQPCISLLKHAKYSLQMMLSTEILQQLNATCTCHIATQQSWNTLASKRTLCREQWTAQGTTA